MGCGGWVRPGGPRRTWRAVQGSRLIRLDLGTLHTLDAFPGGPKAHLAGGGGISQGGVQRPAGGGLVQETRRALPLPTTVPVP